jgi:hypothetical protein
MIRLVNEGFTRLLVRFLGRSVETASITMASGFIAWLPRRATLYLHFAAKRRLFYHFP